MKARLKGVVEVRFRCDSMDLAGEALQDLGRFLKVRSRLLTSMMLTVR